jgi:hypothetical protein
MTDEEKQPQEEKKPKERKSKPRAHGTGGLFYREDENATGLLDLLPYLCALPHEKSAFATSSHSTHFKGWESRRVRPDLLVLLSDSGTSSSLQTVSEADLRR